MSELAETRFPADRVKHLEMIQAVIARLASDSFVVKGWAIAVTGVFLGFAIGHDQPWLALPSVLITAMFWLLDTYYLRSERLFRVLYDRVRDPDRDDYEPFAMNATTENFIDSLPADDRKRVTRRSVAFSGTLLSLYIALALGAVAVATATQIEDESACQQGGSHLVSRPHKGA